MEMKGTGSAHIPNAKLNRSSAQLCRGAPSAGLGPNSGHERLRARIEFGGSHDPQVLSTFAGVPSTRPPLQNKDPRLSHRMGLCSTLDDGLHRANEMFSHPERKTQQVFSSHLRAMSTCAGVPSLLPEPLQNNDPRLHATGSPDLRN